MYQSNNILVKLANFLRIDTLLVIQTEILSFTLDVCKHNLWSHVSGALTLKTSYIHNAKTLSKILVEHIFDYEKLCTDGALTIVITYHRSGNFRCIKCTISTSK